MYRLPLRGKVPTGLVGVCGQSPQGFLFYSHSMNGRRCLCVSEWECFCPFFSGRGVSCRKLRRKKREMVLKSGIVILEGGDRMELRFTKRNQTLIAHISGEIDHHTSGGLRLKTDRALEQISGKNIIFCFREVTFMDSSGIGVMIGRYKQIQSLGGRVAIACASPKIADIIALSGLGRLLPVFEDWKAALAYVEGREAE